MDTVQYGLGHSLFKLRWLTANLPAGVMVSGGTEPQCNDRDFEALAFQVPMILVMRS